MHLAHDNKTKLTVVGKRKALNEKYAHVAHSISQRIIKRDFKDQQETTKIAATNALAVSSALRPMVKKKPTRVYL